MALLPFNTNDLNGNPLFVSPLITGGRNIKGIPYAERPGSPQESYVNNTFRVRRTFDVPWHLRWYFIYAMIGDSAHDSTGKLSRRVPNGYWIRNFKSIYDNLNILGNANPKNAWLFASGIDNIEPVAFDGKDSIYVKLSDQMLFGDIANAGKFPANEGDGFTINPVETFTPVSGIKPVSQNKTIKSFGEESPKKRGIQKKASGMERLRFVRETLSKHDVKVVYKDVIKEIKREEKKKIKEQFKDPKEIQSEYKRFVRQLKKESAKPIQSPKRFNAAKGFEGNDYPPDIDEAGNYQIPGSPANSYPETVFEPGGPFEGLLDPTAVAKYKLARITVAYENINYRISSPTGLAYPPQNDLWQDNFLTFYRMPSAEVLSLPFGAYRFYDKDPAQRYVVTGSNMRLISQEEIMITWHQVPFVPDAVRTHIGKVNDDWFPIGHLQVADNEKLQNFNHRLWAAPGTLLLTNVELKPYKSFFSRRVYDINFKFKYFHAVENNELAYSDDIHIEASDPCNPISGVPVCQKMAKGHNFFLKYKYFNPKANSQADQISGAEQRQKDLFNYNRSGECTLSGSTPVYNKCDSVGNPGDFYREYITHDGCPTGTPVYQFANMEELFDPPLRKNECEKPTNNSGSGFKNQGALLVPKPKNKSFKTQINDHLAPRAIKGEVVRPATRNPRLRK